jgi:effector-binding domain-containing protein
MANEPTITEIGAQRAIAERETTTPDGIAAAVDRTFPKLFALLGEQGIAGGGPPYIRYLATGETFEMELGVLLPDDAPAVNGATEVSLPAGRVAVLRHVGPYDGLPAACERLGQWVAAQGERSGGPFWELYVNDPREEPDASTLITDVFQPLA